MKTAKLVIGIISILLFVLITFQSCAAGVANALTESESTSGSGGFLLAICMLIGGIVGIAAGRKTKVGSIVTGVFYLFGALIGVANSGGSFKDLVIWSVISSVFGLLFLVSGIKMVKPPKDV